VWHKIDLVRVRDRKAPGGWRYYAHLLTHQPGYQSLATQLRRDEIPTQRRAGVDANVSNPALASFPDGRPDQLVVEQITCTSEQQKAAENAARRARARQRAMDRSRRNSNPDQYGVELTDPDDPRTARVDYSLAHALRAGLASQQEREGSVNRHQPPTAHDGVGAARTGGHRSVASAEQAALGPPPNRPGSRAGRRGRSRKEQPPKLFGAARPSQVNS
jgi:hypothetical protein